jgi:hypothetical protein
MPDEMFIVACDTETTVHAFITEHAVYLHPHDAVGLDALQYLLDQSKRGNPFASLMPTLRQEPVASDFTVSCPNLGGKPMAQLFATLLAMGQSCQASLDDDLDPPEWLADAKRLGHMALGLVQEMNQEMASTDRRSEVLNTRPMGLRYSSDWPRNRSN